jgi:DNA-binding response OmpR family regulator
MWKVPPPIPDIQVGDILICPDQRQVFIAGKEVKFHFREFNLLWALAMAGGRILTTGWILDNVWDANVEHSSVKVYIKYIRQKLGHEAKRIITLPSVGYRLDQD